MGEIFNLPQWLSGIWAVYGEIITPMLVTVAVAIVSRLAVKFSMSSKNSNVITATQTQLLTNIANKEDTKPQLIDTANRLVELEKKTAIMGDMINAAFQNANIDPETKATLESMNNKLKYGTDDELIKALEDDNKKLKEQTEALTNQIESTIVVPTETVPAVKKRTRR